MTIFLPPTPKLSSCLSSKQCTWWCHFWSYCRVTKSLPSLFCYARWSSSWKWRETLHTFFAHGNPLSDWTKWVKWQNFKKVIYTFFGELTYKSHPSTDFHAWWLKRCGLAQGCAFFGGGFVDIAAHFWELNTPKNSNFGGVNRRFPAKRAKYWKFHIIETTPSISAKFCTTIGTTKWSSWVVWIVPNKSKMADGRHFEKAVKSPY